jgi:hypothetical protein
MRGRSAFAFRDRGSTPITRDWLLAGHSGRKGIGVDKRLKGLGLRSTALVNRIYVIGHDMEVV